MSSPFALELFPNLAEPAPARRSATRNNPVRARSKLNTAEGRRLDDLYRAILQAIGGCPSGQQQYEASHAAELSLFIENERAKLLRGAGDANALIQLSKARDRALRKLGLDKPPDNSTESPSIRDRLLRDQQQRGAV